MCCLLVLNSVTSPPQVYSRDTAAGMMCVCVCVCVCLLKTLAAANDGCILFSQKHPRVLLLES